MNIEEKIGELQTRLERFLAGEKKRLDDLQRQVDAIDLRGGAGPLVLGGRKSLDDIVKAIAEHPGFEPLQKSGHGRAVVQVPNLLEMKAAITSGTLVPYNAEAGIAATGRKRYGRVRAALRSTTIDTGSAHFVRETAFTDVASPQVEANAKQESSFTFEADTADVRTIAHWTQASKQVLDDMTELGEHIRTSLIYGLEREFEEQLLFGDGTGQNLGGLTVNSTAFDTSILVASDGWEYADVLGAAALQLEEAGYGCDTFVVAPRVWFYIMKQKNANGDYIFGSPASERMREVLWNVQVIPSPAIPSGKFLAGDFENGAHIRMRQESTIDISDSHSDFFTKNLIAIRGEMRAALVKTKPAAFVYGDLAQSPA